jgi:hypothetical protein
MLQQMQVLNFFVVRDKRYLESVGALRQIPRDSRANTLALTGSA